MFCDSVPLHSVSWILPIFEVRFNFRIGNRNWIIYAKMIVWYVGWKVFDNKIIFGSKNLIPAQNVTLGLCKLPKTRIVLIKTEPVCIKSSMGNAQIAKISWPISVREKFKQEIAQEMSNFCIFLDQMEIAVQNFLTISVKKNIH